MILVVIGILIGCMLVCAGLYYLVQEKEDVEARKIYSITVAGGVLVAMAALIKAFVF